jgi:hypothetical protein
MAIIQLAGGGFAIASEPILKKGSASMHSEFFWNGRWVMGFGYLKVFTSREAAELEMKTINPLPA